MTLTLDPRFPVLWRTPDSLQLGVDNPPVMLTEVSNAHERMLAALAIGLTPQGLVLIGSEAGLSRDEIAEFEHAIRPALLTPKVTPDASVEVDGFGPTADRLEWRLREAGLHPRRMPTHAGSASGNAADTAVRTAVGTTIGTTVDTTVDTTVSTAEPRITDFAIVIGDYVLHPERRGRWLRRDIPHLPVVFGDTSVTIGPFIEPGTGPCLYCLELHRRDADPAWPALASQLLAKASTAQSPFIASEAATIATRMMLHRATGGAAEMSTSVTLNIDTGECRQQSWSVHPECACAGLSPVDTRTDAPHCAPVSGQYPPETAKASSSRTSDRATETTRGAATCVPA